MPAAAHQRAPLEHARKPKLHLGIEIGELVEKQRAAVGLLDQALLHAGDVLDAEQRLRRVLARDRAGGDGHERAVASRAALVQRARECFLAGAGLAVDQHPGVVRGETLDLLAQRLHAASGADDFDRRGQLPAQAFVLALEPARFERARNHQQELRQRNGFFDEIPRAKARRLDRRLDRAVAADHDHGTRQSAALAPLAQKADAVEIRHPDVEQHEIRTLQPARLARSRGRFGRVDDVTLVLEDVPDGLPDVRLVVDDEHAGVRHGLHQLQKNDTRA